MTFIFLRYFIHCINNSMQEDLECLPHLNSKSLEYVALKHSTYILVTFFCSAVWALCLNIGWETVVDAISSYLITNQISTAINPISGWLKDKSRMFLLVDLSHKHRTMGEQRKNDSVEIILRAQAIVSCKIITSIDLWKICAANECCHP